MLSRHLGRTGFKRQLMATVTGAILCMALLSSLMNALEARRRVRRYLLEEGRLVTANLARQSALALLYRAQENARDAVAATLSFPDVSQVDIFDASQHVLLTQTKSGAKLPSDAHAPVDHAMLESETDDEWIFAAPVTIGQADQSPFDATRHPPQVLGTVRVMLGKRTMENMVAYLLLGNLAITFSIAAILLLLLRFLARRMIRPLHALSGLMRRAECGESGMRATPAGPRDIIEMAQAFNKMMAVLEEREAELIKSRDDAVHTALLKTQFAATVSHEIRTPLNGVVGMLDLLKEMRLTKRQRECVDVAWNSSHSLIELINDVLDFSKMEAGKLTLEETDFSLRHAVEEVLELLAPQAQHKGLDLGYLQGDDVPEQIRGDALRLRQVLINLVGNAVKFTEHGEVAVRIRSDQRAGDTISLHFEVSDSGIGMGPETLGHAFDSFSQADRSSTRKYGGTGLGLAICRQLVEAMGGQIGVASVPGCGSTFWFTIQCGAVPSPVAQPIDPLLKGARLLAIDSSDVVRRFLEQALTRQGIFCRAVRTGSEALAELSRATQQQQAYQLLIMDSAATDGNGADLAGRIRSDAAIGAVRLLVLDRYGAPRGSNVLGADGYLGKPLRLAPLQDTVRRLLTGAERRRIRQRESDHAHENLAAPAKEYRVLVAEDNRTNQMVAAGILTMIGCHSEFAGNGSEAVEAARTVRFDLILMDCSMPEMDGYEATAHIRHFEQLSGRRTPIIAMTANTQHGDAAKCLASGMDDYLAKPVTVDELRRKLERWLPGVTHADHVRPCERILPDDEGGPLDRDTFENLRQILGAALPKAVAPFLEDMPLYLDQLEHAIHEDDAETARATAHSIKGSSGNLGAITLSLIARDVEELALGRQLQRIPPLLPPLRRAFDAVAVVLASEAQGGEFDAIEPDQQTAQVLVVDDDRSTRTALRYTLQQDGFRVQEAADGAQALAMLKRFQPDVILMDAVMPVMDGFTACARVKELPEGHAIPVLMITALEDNTSVEKAFAAGASDYIPKPIHFAVLSQRVRRIIDANHAEKHIRHLAYNDILTGLPNRALFFDQLNRRLALARQAGEAVAVLFLDLDRFKYVNDTLGHDDGDRLLIAVAQRIRRIVRSVDCVARLGGDEFTVALANINGASAAAAAQNICRTLAAPFEIDGHDLFVTASVGIALYPHDGADAGELLKHADMAMYQAKKTNRGFHFFEASLEQSTTLHLHMENDLRRALERGELDVHYQPKARVASGEVVGMEALVRWRHPTRGVVAPNEFIPLAEETGLIIPIGEWVLRTACAQTQAWIEQGFTPLKVAVNLSGRQMRQKDFVATVEQVLAETGLPPNLLELEITESTLMEYAQETLEVLQRIRDLGVRLSIDDFGTGYSSLAYLKRFPVNSIKIDRSFVRDVPDDADDVALVTGIIALAHSLRLDVVAEGVETEAQLAFLRAQSCDMMQGYLLSQPLSAEQFARTMMKKETRRTQ